MGDQRPIGVFDSGVGGLTILSELERLLPNESYAYFGDTAHCPYGAKPREEIRRRCAQVTQFLLDQGAKLVVVACNSASAAALATLRAAFSVPFVGMEPAVKPAAQLTKTGRVGVLATQLTASGRPLEELIANYAVEVEVLIQVGDGLVELVEMGEAEGPRVEAALHRALSPMLQAGIDTLVLACTHYPFLRPTIQRLVGPEVTILDPAEAVALQVQRVLAAQELENPQGRGGRSFFASGPPDRFAETVYRLTGRRLTAHQALSD